MTHDKQLLTHASAFPPSWAERLTTYGYTTVDQFLSTCRVPSGRTALATTLQVTEDDVRAVEQALTDACGATPELLAPVVRPLGLLVRPPSPDEPEVAEAAVGQGGQHDD